MPKIVTANTLTTGTVVFLGEDGKWTPDVEKARLYDGADAAEEGLLAAQQDAERSLVVDPFVTDKRPDADGKPGMTLRDRIRAFGPTIEYLQPDGQRLSPDKVA